MTHAEIDDSQNSTVPQALHHFESAEILVQRHKNPCLPPFVGENLFVSRVLRPITRPFHIVTRRLQFGGDAAADAGVEQQPHAAESTMNGSTRS